MAKVQKIKKAKKKFKENKKVLRHKKAQPEKLSDFFKASPLVGIELTRDKSAVRSQFVISSDSEKS